MQDLESSPSSTRRIAVWIFACLAVMIAWSYIAPRPVPPPAERPAAPEPSPPAATAVASPQAATAPGSDGAIPEAVAAAALPPPLTELSRRRVTGTTDIWSVELSNVGGRLTSWKLLGEGNYGNPAEPLEIVRRRVPRDAAAPAAEPAPSPPVSDDQDILPLQVVTGDAALDARLAQALHAVAVESLPDRQVLSARWSDGAGTSVEKIVTLLRDAPLATVEAHLQVGGRPAAFHLAWGPGLCNHTRDEHSNIYFRRGNIAWLGDEKVRTVDRPDKQKAFPDSPVRWAALQDSYFAVLFTPHAVSTPGGIPSTGPRSGFRAGGTLPLDAKGKADKSLWPEELLLLVPFAPEAPTQALYVGARDRVELTRLESRFTSPPQLPMLTHLGMLDGLARLLHWPLLRFHGWTGSWGIAVVLLTLLVRVIIGPLQFMSMKKMRGMQEKMKPVQSQLKAMDEKFKKMPPSRENRMRHMEEKQKLMLDAGINPADTLSGCLPMLITMPVFFALLKLLPNAPEFRLEPFLFWKDLAAADSTHVLPILAAVLTLISTKMGMSSSATTIDPVQRNMLYMFPLMLVWLCWSAPVAFVVYQVVMSAVQIGQQQLFNMAMPPVEAVKAPKGSRHGKPPSGERPDAIASTPPGTAPRPAEARKKGRKR